MAMIEPKTPATSEPMTAPLGEPVTTAPRITRKKRTTSWAFSTWASGSMRRVPWKATEATMRGSSISGWAQSHQAQTPIR